MATFSSSNSNGSTQDEITLAYTLLQSSMESLKDILIFSIDKDYHYLTFNNAFKDATFYAYGTKVAKGMSMLDTILDDRERIKAKTNCDRALKGENHTTVEIYGTVNPNYFETRYSPIVNAEGSIIGVTILSTNITERKMAEEQILSLNKELEAFSYSVAHDLRAPLRIINGYSGILLEDHLQSLNEECQKLLTNISGNVKKMNQLIEDLLNFSKLGKTPVNKTRIDVSKLINSILEEQIPPGNNNKIEVQLGAITDLNGDSNLIRHVFYNLISNAIKYSQKREKSLIKIDSVNRGTEITYSIQDNGVGFDMRYANKLFQVFKRLHNDAEFEGTGVGLAIVQRIIAKHGGKIWVDAKEDKGATFNFTLPA